MNSLLLKKLCEADSIASHEDEVRTILYSELAKLSDEIFCDDLGSLIFYKKVAQRILQNLCFVLIWMKLDLWSDIFLILDLYT